MLVRLERMELVWDARVSSADNDYGFWSSMDGSQVAGPGV